MEDVLESIPESVAIAAGAIVADAAPEATAIIADVELANAARHDAAQMIDSAMNVDHPLRPAKRQQPLQAFMGFQQRKRRAGVRPAVENNPIGPRGPRRAVKRRRTASRRRSTMRNYYRYRRSLFARRRRRWRSRSRRGRY